ncbi:MAG: sodium:panthothenate symporter, partial [Lentisphaeria bacterium]|nr:sodium:panthothenate symporter [Lentisphaeria bacterium]
LSVGGVVTQRNWANHIYPLLENLGWAEPIGRFLENVSAPFSPWIVWRMNPVKFPINSTEIFFISMLASMSAYWIVSLITYRKPFDLDRMLHRGIWRVESEERNVQPKLRWRDIPGRLIGITAEYTTADRVIAWGVFFYNIVFSFGIAFVGVLIWNLVSSWAPHAWGNYFLWVWLIIPGIAAVFSAVWFSIGGVIDLRRMFIDLAKRKTDFSDNGLGVGEPAAAVADKLDDARTKKG